MGETCSLVSPNVDSEPNKVTGLSENDQKRIIDTWHQVNRKNAFKHNGQMFFIKLFLKYPSVQYFFPELIGINPSELKKSFSLRAHGVAVFTVMSTYIDCMDDPDTFIALVHKRTVQHFEYGVKVENMESDLLRHITTLLSYVQHQKLWNNMKDMCVPIRCDPPNRDTFSRTTSSSQNSWRNIRMAQRGVRQMLKEVFLEFMAERTHQKSTSKAIAAWDKFFTFHNEIFNAKWNELQLARVTSDWTVMPEIDETQPISTRNSLEKKTPTKNQTN